jgi:hypothetical protein
LHKNNSKHQENSMAAAEGQASPPQPETWHGVVLQTLERNDIRLAPYVPDRVLTTLSRISTPIHSSLPSPPRK